MKNFKLNNYKETISQIRHFYDGIKEQHYTERIPMEVVYTYDPDNPIAIENLKSRQFSPLAVGEKWGDLWGSAWMKFHAVIPEKWTTCELVALIDIDAEGCVFVDGVPSQGLTHKSERFTFHRKRRYPVTENVRKGSDVSILMEAGANQIGGEWGEKKFFLRQAELAVFDRRIWKFILDFQFLLNLAETLPRKSIRAKKIIQGLIEIMGLWQSGTGLENSLALTEKLLSGNANKSSLEAVSIGHAHLDLAWLWPIRETRRKAGRTFSTALSLIEEYSEYNFGASQPQLFQWIKEDYPLLFNKIKKAVTDKRIECQGAMWVEPDMNLISGESMVRQCMYGLQFYREEFGLEVKNLWLPDVFGFSSALPQILKKCGVDHFLSIKLAWNDTNEFPHHTFWWEGIDGTKVLTHFPPAKEYHTANTPKDLVFAEENYKEFEINNSFMNLFGIGDGGGGPSREHIEFGMRSRDCEGLPRLRFDHARTFFNDLEKQDLSALPVWDDELYFEFHRGTYTSQSKLKQLNRQIEIVLRDVEFYDSLSSEDNSVRLEEAWKTLMLHQFHDILPGSSINIVNEEAKQVLSALRESLINWREEILLNLLNVNGNKSGDRFTVFNSLSWNRNEIVEIPLAGEGNYRVIDSAGSELESVQRDNTLLVSAHVPSMGYEVLKLEKVPSINQVDTAFMVEQNTVENNRIRLIFADDGSINSIYDKTLNREWLSGSANRLLLWEDDPHRWDAWEITPYYRNSEPESARLISRQIESNRLFSKVVQHLEIGDSTIIQTITLRKNSSFIELNNVIDWKESHKMLKVHGDFNVKSDFATFEIQYGTLRRSTKNNNSWQQAQFEVPGHRFADISTDKYGMSLINDSSNGFRVKDGSLEQTLLRSSKDPDGAADMGTHNLSFAYYPHKNNFVNSSVFAKAHEFNSPLLVLPVDDVETCRFPAGKSLYNISGRNVKIEVVKKSQDMQRTIIRLYETGGEEQKVIFKSMREWKEIYETDLLERKTGEKKGSGRNLALDFKPFEIKTLALGF